jgi:hypothetical protein
MLAMWHRVLTRPWGFMDNTRETLGGSGEALRKEIARSDVHIVANNIASMMLENVGKDGVFSYADFGTCKPLSDSCWVEFAVMAKQQLLQVGTHCLRHRDANHYVASSFVNIDGEPVLAHLESFDFDDNGCLLEIRGGNGQSSQATTLRTFAFAHCRNVELVDCTKEHGPDEKFCRRQKVPSVIYKTLKIPGVTKQYADAGGTSGVEMRAHICRGHFATYTADKPLFGRPDGIGKFWHPAHVRGNAKHGAVVKDYEVSV